MYCLFYFTSQSPFSQIAIDILNRFGDSSTATNGSRPNPGGNAIITANQPHHHHHQSHTTKHPTTQPQHSHHHHHHHTQIPLPTATPYRPVASSNSSLTPRAPLARQLLPPGSARTPAKPAASFQLSTPAASTQAHAHTLQLAGATPLSAQQQQRQQQQMRMASPAAYGALQLHQQQYPKTPYPIINFNAKGYMEKLVDFLIGEGVSSQYGMICKECFQHNGIHSFRNLL